MDSPTNCMMWNMTRKCNFQCKYCYFPHDSSPVENPLPVERILAMLDKTGRTWSMDLTGGEPFVYPGFVDICLALTERHIIGLDTNLSLSSKVRDFAARVDPSRVKDLYIALHIEERERRKGVPAFIENVLLLKKKGFHLAVNYVLHPTLLERYPKDYEYFKAQGVELTPRPFKGVFEGVEYPYGYDDQARGLIAQKPRAGRKMVYNFKGVPCHAGSRLLRLEPDGSVFRCSGDRTRLGSVLGEVELYDGPRPCKVPRCPCFGPDYVVPDQAQQEFMRGLSLMAIGRGGEARQSFDRVLALDPNSSNALNNLGVLDKAEGDAVSALERFSRARAMHPGNKVYALNQAAELAAGGRIQEAEEVLAGFSVNIADLSEKGGARVCVDLIPADTPGLVFEF